MAFEVSVQEGVATLTLNNPPQNRLNSELIWGCAAAVDQIRGDDGVRVHVIRAVGENFSFGGDIASWDMTDPEPLSGLFAVGLRISNALEQPPVNAA